MIIPHLSYCIHLVLVIYVLRICRDHLLEHFYDLCAANIPWSFHTHSFLWFMCCEHTVITCLNVLPSWCYDYLLACLPLWYKNVIKIHFAMKTLKRVNMVMWALETKLVQPKGYGSHWLLDTKVWVFYTGAWLVHAFVYGILHVLTPIRSWSKIPQSVN